MIIRRRRVLRNENREEGEERNATVRVLKRMDGMEKKKRDEE